jgi:hypothetical protein
MVRAHRHWQRRFPRPYPVQRRQAVTRVLHHHRVAAPTGRVSRGIRRCPTRRPELDSASLPCCGCVAPSDAAHRTWQLLKNGPETFAIARDGGWQSWTNFGQHDVDRPPGRVLLASGPTGSSSLPPATTVWIPTAR